MWLQLLAVLCALVAFVYALRARSFTQSTVHHPRAFEPVLGLTRDVLANFDRHYDWKLEKLQEAVDAGKELLCVSMFAAPCTIEVITPRMVEFILKDAQPNFEKGAYFQDIFRSLLGVGIFNVDHGAWRSQRKIASHMFSSRKLNEYMLATFKEHSAIVIAQLDKLADSGRSIDLQDLFSRYTLDSIGKIAFGIDLHSLTAERQPAFARAFDAAQETAALRWFFPPIVWRTRRMLGLGREGELPGQLRTINEFVFAVVKARRENLEAYADSGDLLSLFLNDAAKRGEELTDEFLRDVILNFLIAGRDTTASALSYMFRALSEHPAVEAAAVEELARVLPSDSDASISLDESALKDLRYLEATFLETTRLFSPVAGDMKRAVDDCVFPDGTKVKAGTMVAYSIYALNRLSTEYWGKEGIADFRPERWLDERGSVRVPSAFVFPSFNAGPRICLGRSMAITEGKTLAAAILQKFRVRVDPQADLSYKISVVLSMKHGMPVTITRR